jgi:hypothetical protein
LVSRRVISGSPRATRLLSLTTARLGLAVFAVMAFTALFVASSFGVLLGRG